MKATALIELLQGLIEQDGDKQVRIEGRTITGAWVLPPNPTNQERYIALSTGTSTGRISVS